MTADILAGLPSRRGHFLLESGYHTDLWLTLDAIFADPRQGAPLVTALAERLRPHRVSAVCGPLVGGAFLAQALATHLGVGSYYTMLRPPPVETGLFTTTYVLPRELGRRAHGERVAVVDDVISAGSSVRATIAALAAAGASTAVVAAFLVLGDSALTHFAGCGVPVEALDRRNFSLWEPKDCPLCRTGAPLEDPRNR